MKKWLYLLLSVLVLVWLSITFYIPGKLRVVEFIPVDASPSGISRFLSDESKWISWWPDSSHSGNPVPVGSSFLLTHNGYKYRLTEKLYRAFDLELKKEGRTFGSQLSIIPADNFRSSLKWQTELNPGWNPFNKMRDYRAAVGIKQELHSMLLYLQSFLSKPENLYAVPIVQTRVSDTVLIATRMTSRSHPTVEVVYKMIGELRDYVRKQNGRETGYPMLHSWIKESGQVETMVAIPTDKRLPENGRFFLRLMVPGNILVTEVKGGFETIHNATTALENYISDYQKIKMAIPFESLITERMHEPDTAKWVTKVYFPIMK